MQVQQKVLVYLAPDDLSQTYSTGLHELSPPLGSLQCQRLKVIRLPFGIFHRDRSDSKLLLVLQIKKILLNDIFTKLKLNQISEKYL